MRFGGEGEEVDVFCDGGVDVVVHGNLFELGIMD